MAFVSPMWDEYFKKIENVNLDRFWEHPTIKQTITSVGKVYETKMHENLHDFNRSVHIVGELNFNSTLWNNLSSSLWRYIYYYTLITDVFGSLKNKNVLEIGSGYGGLVRVLTALYNVRSYTAIDDSRMLKILNHFMQGNIDPEKLVTHPIEDISVVTKGYCHYDLFISTVCLSETTDEFVDYLIENIFPKCSQFFIINSNENGLIERLKYSIENLNKLVIVSKYINYKNVYVLFAKGIK